MLTGADCSWPSDAELAQANAIRKSCLTEIAALDCPSRDVVGDVRLCRFLRFNSGNVEKATKGYREFLTWRKVENIDALRGVPNTASVLELGPKDFMSWIDEIRSPYAPPMCMELGVSPDGHSVIFAAPGFFKAAEFVSQRPPCQTLDTDLLMVWTCTEWMLKRLDDRSYELGKICYSIKIIDMGQLGKEKIPIFVSEIRDFAKKNVPPIMAMYCEHDIKILILNPPFVFRVVWAFAKNLLSKRQADRMQILSDPSSASSQALLRSFLTRSATGPGGILAEETYERLAPPCLGGTLTHVPLAFPIAHEDKTKVDEWMKRTVPGFIRDAAPACPYLRPPESGNRTVIARVHDDGSWEPVSTPAQGEVGSKAAQGTIDQQQVVKEEETLAASTSAAAVVQQKSAEVVPPPVSAATAEPEAFAPEVVVAVVPSKGWFCC